MIINSFSCCRILNSDFISTKQPHASLIYVRAHPVSANHPNNNKNNTYKSCQSIKTCFAEGMRTFALSHSLTVVLLCLIGCRPVESNILKSVEVMNGYLAPFIRRIYICNNWAKIPRRFRCDAACQHVPIKDPFVLTQCNRVNSPKHYYVI